LNQLDFAMWTPSTRQQHSRPVSRYQTDLTDSEWRVIAPHLPKPCATGRPREWPMREILNGIFYVVRAGCPWRLLPNDLRCSCVGSLMRRDFRNRLLARI
jgi:transposase